jgi:glycosyltransferase involved in cell wall biosynthesis
MAGPDDGDGTYYFSGAVGDGYIALCKLASSGKPARLRRLCRFAGADQHLTFISQFFPNITYDPNFIKFDTIADMASFAFGRQPRYINIFADGNGRGREPDDPPECSSYAAPVGVRPVLPVEVNNPVVGIHLHSGVIAGLQRALDVAFVADLCARLSGLDITVLLLGTGDVYEESELGELEDLGPNVINLVGKDTIEIWTSCLAALDLLIAPDGLATFFALSCGVPAVVFYQAPDVVIRSPSEWRRIASFRSVGGGEITPSGRWHPDRPDEVVQIVQTRLDPGSLLDFPPSITFAQ